MLFIFDLDGTLVNAPWKALFKAYIAIIKAEEKDYRIFFKNLKEFKNWWELNWQRNILRIGIKDIEKANKIFYEIYNPYVCLFPWVDSVIEKLAKSHQLAILTSRHKGSAIQLLGSAVEYFSFVVGAEDVKHLKPNPEGINLILNEILPVWIWRRRVLLIGDTTGDILAGKAAGIKTAAVKWGLGNWEELLALEPDYQFRTYKDLLKL